MQLRGTSPAYSLHVVFSWSPSYFASYACECFDINEINYMHTQWSMLFLHGFISSSCAQSRNDINLMLISSDGGSFLKTTQLSVWPVHALLLNLPPYERQNYYELLPFCIELLRTSYLYYFCTQVVSIVTLYSLTLFVRLFFIVKIHVYILYWIISWSQIFSY